jgi:predicted enzyme related to lactoylglutathione lyase
LAIYRKRASPAPGIVHAFANPTGPEAAMKTAARSASVAPNVAHFAINADDVHRARRFYQDVFGWRFDAWGPPNFLMISTGTEQQPGIMGALQGRRELVPGEKMTGFECTIAVSDVDATAAAVIASGGTVIMPRATIPTVGHLIFFRDTEGNVAGAMQYDAKAGIGDTL